MKKFIIIILLLIAGTAQAQFFPTPLPSWLKNIRSSENTWTAPQTFNLANLRSVYTNGNIKFYDITGTYSLNLKVDSAAHYNTYLGLGSGDSNNIAKYNTGLGYLALHKTQSGWGNTAVGYKVLSSGVGTGSLDISGTGIEFYANSGFGSSALLNTTTGSYSSAFGVNALLNNTTGSYNNAFGVHALDNNIVGNYNNAFGNYALYNSKGDYNSAFGHGAFTNKKSGNYGIAFGYNAGYSDTGTTAPNMYIGGQAGYSNATSGYNTIIGYQSCFGITGNSYLGNTTLGYKSLYTVTTGGLNTVIGTEAGNRLTTGTRNTFIGFNAGKDNQKVDATNTTAIGNETYTSKDNQVVIGNANVTETQLRGNVISPSVTNSIDSTGATEDSVYIGRYTMLVNCGATDSNVVWLSDYNVTAGQRYVVKKIDANSINVIVKSKSGYTIDGAISKIWNTQYQTFTFVYRNKTWYIL